VTYDEELNSIGFYRRTLVRYNFSLKIGKHKYPFWN